MINKTIYIRYISLYGWTYLVSEDYVDEFNIANSGYIDSIWDIGSFNIELDDSKYLISHLECIKDKVFNEMCFIYTPQKSSNPSPTIKDSTEPRSGYDLHPTISIDNFGNPPII